MTSPETYIKNFTSLTCAPGAVWGEATRKRALHKPILLLAVLGRYRGQVPNSAAESISSGYIFTE